MSESKPVVVVADSEPSNIEFYNQVCDEAGATMVSTGVAERLFSLVVAQQPALVIVDSLLENPDSYQLLNRLKSDDETRHIPVLFVVANLSDRKIALHQSLFKLVRVESKPLAREAMSQLIQRYLKLNHYHTVVNALAKTATPEVVDGVHEGILGIDHDGKILFANFAAEMLLQANALDLVGNYLESLFEERCVNVLSKWREHPVAKVTASDQILQVDRASLWRKDGESISCKFAAVPLPNLEGIHLLFAFKQLKDSRESKDKIAQLSQVDHLTGLPVRNAIIEQIDRCSVKATLSSYYFAILSVDLDHFRYINESLGHELGDLLIKEVAERIQKLLRRDDVLARMEGDEFAVLLSHIDLPENAGMIAKKIVDKVREPFLVDGHELFTGCSIGVSVYPSCGDNAQALLKNAEVALSRAKATGRNSYQYFTRQMNEARTAQMQFEKELHLAVKKKQWRIQYLPVVKVNTGEVAACEIKLSWLHPTRGELAMDAFLSEAEEAGLAAPIFTWLWRQALHRFRKLSAEAKTKVRLIVPVSPSILLQEGGVEWALESIQWAGLTPEQIYVELPETYYTLRHSEHGEVLNALSKAGFHLVLDGFGTGFAPMNLLKEIPYSFIKLSHSFVVTCAVSKTDQAIIKGTIDMVKNLGIQVMAAAVDSQSQWQFLVDSGCDWLCGDVVEKDLEQTPQKLDAMGIFVVPG